MKYLIDTNICIYIMNRKPIRVIKRLHQLAVDEIGISSITVSELLYGVEKSRQQKKNRQRLSEFLAPFTVFPYDAEAAAAYGRLRADLEKRGQVIGPLDLLIAAHAVCLDSVLVTNNEKEFQRITELRVENWANLS